MPLKQRLREIPIFLPFAAIYTWIIIQTAWVSDDAYITFRSIENFIHGYGPTYNIGVRVQSFTHPLWFFLQSLANWVLTPWRSELLGNSQLYYVNILLSVGISILCILLLWLISPNNKTTIFAISILSLSKAFVDYSTSGLENPVTHLLLAIFLILSISGNTTGSPRLFSLALIAALAGLNRIDLLVMFLPALLYFFIKSENKISTLGIFAAGFLPLIVWEIFSMIYYGFPFPNTAYIKLHAGIDKQSLLEQGLHYYLNSLRMDPLTLLTIAFVLVFLVLQKDTLQKMFLAGIGLYLLYIFYIGGDFMSGRFFTAPLFMAVALLARHGVGSSFKVFSIGMAVVLLVGIAPIYTVEERDPSWVELTGKRKKFIDENGIADERSYYYQQVSFMKNLDGSPSTYKADWVFHDPRPAQVEVVTALGLAGYRLGPDVHVIDRHALADPLLARMPLESIEDWRIGHYEPIIPDGYLEALATGENRIQDPEIARYYDQLAIVVSGELWSLERFNAIWILNTGAPEFSY